MQNRTLILIAVVSILGTVSPSWASPAEDKIAAAQKAITKSPESPDGHNALAMAFAARARETADPAYYTKGDAEAARALELDPGNLDSARARIWLALGKHEFARALDLAAALNKKVPDDLLTYAFLTDANVELGRYADAERAADWLLRLRPGNVAGLTRAAYLREIYGDIEGALELMRKAFQRTRPNETEELAWIMTHIGHLHLTAGNIPLAEAAATEALRLFPGYHYALAALGKVRTRQQRHADATQLFERRYAVAPHPENLYDLANALHHDGQVEEAREAFRMFEAAARAEMNGPDNSNRELIAYYAGIGANPEEALRIAAGEKKIRQDVFTLHSHALALHANGRLDEARAEIQRALAIGVRDPDILAHAAAIERASLD